MKYTKYPIPTEETIGNPYCFTKSAIRLVGGDLTNAFLTMLNTGQLSFKDLAKDIGDMIKKLIAAAIAALILVALLSAVGLADFKNFGKKHFPRSFFR